MSKRSELEAQLEKAKGELATQEQRLRGIIEKWKGAGKPERAVKWAEELYSHRKSGDRAADQFYMVGNNSKARNGIGGFQEAEEDGPVAALSTAEQIWKWAEEIERLQKEIEKLPNEDKQPSDGSKVPSVDTNEPGDGITEPGGGHKEPGVGGGALHDKSGKLPKPRSRAHSWRCANSTSEKCGCSCGGKFHGTGVTGVRG
jgi:hypothetical protein